MRHNLKYEESVEDTVSVTMPEVNIRHEFLRSFLIYIATYLAVVVVYFITRS